MFIVKSDNIGWVQGNGTWSSEYVELQLEEAISAVHERLKTILFYQSESWGSFERHIYNGRSRDSEYYMEVVTVDDLYPTKETTAILSIFWREQHNWPSATK